MEGPPGLKKATIAITIIILFHIVGLVGFFIPAIQPLFLKIVPFHLLLMFAVVVYSHQVFNKKLVAFIAITFVLGFAAEWVGVHLHLIFGNYFYGKTLGLKLFDIPLMIGVNWFLLIYCTGVFMQYSGIKNLNLRVILGAVVLVLLDVLIEPIAIRFDYWHWAGLTAPGQNYLGWFILSGLMLGIFEAFKFSRQSSVGAVLLIAQYVFFALLHLV
ncbi:putative membrane protein [Mucilaginibacter gracilis]|uniref:Putative membrane protein n=1 Tax=Mucilaginibacter gracilis TaxID=423350 RepID=A0A495J8L0_9SPHI|nr:carotenoid biosynthesis protein [Mucilaginibacter gracilis]RKR85340.1 putative membrane protein [Mucilaginibacter gracilis]